MRHLQHAPASTPLRVYSFDRKVYDRTRRALGIGLGLGIGLSSSPGAGPGTGPAAIFGASLLLDHDSTQGLTPGTGSGASAWAPISGAGTYSQATAAAQPVITASDATFGGRQTLTFTAAQSMTSARTLPQAGTTPWCIYWVGMLPSLGATVIPHSDSGGASLAAYMGSSGAGYTLRSYNATAVVTTTVYAFGTWYLFRHDFSNSAADKLAAGALATGTTGSAGNAAATGLGRGLNVNAPGLWSVARAFEVDVIPSGTQDTAVRAYIAAQYPGLVTA